MPRKRRERWEGDPVEGGVFKVVEREAGSGTIDTAKINGREYVRGRVWLSDATGKRIRKPVYGKTRTEVERKIQNLLKDPTASNDAKRLPVSKYLQRWLKYGTANRWRVSTAKGYERTVRLHIIPYVGEVKLAALTPANVAALLSALEKDGAEPRTRQETRKVLRAAYQDAVREGLLVANPVAAVRAPSAPPKKKTILTLDQVAKLYSVMQKDERFQHYFPLVYVAVATGMRSGECCGLEWANVHLDRANPFLNVVQGLTLDDEGKAVLTDAKTDASKRRVELDAATVAVLKRHQAGQKASGYKGPMVFVGQRGALLNRNNILNRALYPALEAAGLPRATFHSLRHVVNSALAQDGENLKVLQQRLGHASPRVTLETYTHLLPTAERNAANKGAALLKAATQRNGAKSGAKSQPITRKAPRTKA